MNLNFKKYVKVFTEEKAEEYKSLGLEFLHEKNGVYWFLNNPEIIKDEEVKYSAWLNF